MKDAKLFHTDAAAQNMFWSERLRRLGHTGWANPTIYAYDQVERIDLVKRNITKKFANGGIALDFGCGTGDFSKLLLKQGFTVFGYDPYVRPDIDSERFIYANSYGCLPKKSGWVDLILSVTVMDHIGDEDALSSALELCQRVLNFDGRLYLLEYALDSEEDRQRLELRNDYQLFRTYAHWQRVLNQHGLEILTVSPVAHPDFCPSSGYQEYSRSFPVTWARRASLPASWLNGLLNWQATRIVRRNGVNSRGPSPLKLLECCLRN